jgi:beta-glucanase (GH16 family)
MASNAASPMSTDMLSKMSSLKTFLPFLSICFQVGTAAPFLPVSDPGNEGGWELIEGVSDEFNGDTLDTSKWHNLGSNGDYLGEWKGRAPSQYSADNVSVSGGKLIIASRWDPDFAFSETKGSNGLSYGKPAPVTTAAIISKTKFHYGYMEMRCRAADGPVSSSFWTTGKGGEIDVFEHFGNNPDNPSSAYRYHTSFHDWRKGSTSFGQRIWTSDHTLNYRVADDFHVYGLEWDPDFLRIYADGKLIYGVTRQELGDQWVAVNEQKIWIDSETFDWEIAPAKLKASDFGEKSKFVIDYCRVWKRSKPSSGLKPRKNLLANSSFEDGLEGWNGEGTSSKNAHSGQSAAALETSGKVQQTVNVKPNTTYVLSAWAMSPDTNEKNLWFKSYLNVASYGGPKVGTQFFMPGYHRKSLQFTTGPESRTATIFITNQPQGKRSIFDTFELFEATK